MLADSPCALTGVRCGAKVTWPGPRNLWKDTVATAAVAAPRLEASEPTFVSFGSFTVTVMAIGWFTTPRQADGAPVGGPANAGPFAANLNSGGLLPMPASW